MPLTLILSEQVHIWKTDKCNDKTENKRLNTCAIQEISPESA